MSILDIFSLKGKKALITGASSGIGEAISRAYAMAGAEIIISARSEHKLEQLETELGAISSVTVLPCDITDISKFTRKINELPDLDVFCNCAGSNRPKPAVEITEEDYDEIMNLNLKAAYFASVAVLAHMKTRGRPGSIINISSQMGHTGAANRTLYCASKWGLEGFTRALSLEAGKDAVRVNTICPTFIKTPLTEPYFKDGDFLNSVLEKISLGRLGELSDVIGAAIYLASDASQLVTGSSLMVDGGWTAS